MDKRNNLNIPEGLSGEYLAAMRTVSHRLLENLPDDEYLWTVLGKTEALLLEAQTTGTPVSDIMGNGGVAGFAQSIIDERLAALGAVPLDKNITPAIRSTHTQNKRTSEYVKKKKRKVTALVIIAWVLVCGMLFAWYSGFIDYLKLGAEFYLEEINNFSPKSDDVALTEEFKIIQTDVNHINDIAGTILYSDGVYDVRIDSVGVDKSANGKTERYWLSLSYSATSSYGSVSYVSPIAAGITEIMHADGVVSEEEICLREATVYDKENNRFKFSVYLFKLDGDEDVSETTVKIMLHDLRRVTWTRTGIGIF